jgi:hypoxanthine-guanine phosphoribosyltransferase
MYDKEKVYQRPSEEDYARAGVVTSLDNLPIIKEEIPNLAEDERIFLLHSEDEVKEKIKFVAAQILEDYEGVENLAILIIENGGRRFGDELLKHLTPLQPLVTYVRLKSYTENNEQKEVEQLSPVYTVIKDFDGNERKVTIPVEEVSNYKWLISDDVIDEVKTIIKAESILSEGKAGDIKVVSMFNKNSLDIPDYCCFPAYKGFWLVGANMGRGDDFTTLPTGPLSVGVYTKTEEIKE